MFNIIFSVTLIPNKEAVNMFYYQIVKLTLLWYMLVKFEEEKIFLV